jgi:LuxR family quorum sensing-dependent transcriptional regulator
MKQWEIDLLQIVAENVHRRLLDLGPTPPKTYDDLHVTRSESECLTLCSAGKTDKEIGAITHRSQRTVQAHLQNLQRKLGAANRAQLIAEAFRRGLQR